MKLNELDPDSRVEYQRLINENKMLLNEIQNQKMELEEVNNTLFKLDSKLRMDANKQKSMQLKETVGNLENKRNDLAV